MGASGTEFELVDIDEALRQIPRLPRDGEQAVEEARAGRALTFRGPDGVFVLTLQPGHNAGEFEAFVLLAVASRVGAFERAEPAALAIARDLAAATVAFRSVRRGWARKLGPAWRSRGERGFWRLTT